MGCLVGRPASSQISLSGGRLACSQVLFYHRVGRILGRQVGRILGPKKVLKLNV